MIDTLLLIHSLTVILRFLERTNHKLLSQLCFVFISLLCHLAYHVPSKVDKQALTLPSPRVAILTKLSEGRVTSVLQPSPGNLVVRFRSSPIISRYCVSPPKTAFLSSSPLLLFMLAPQHNFYSQLSREAFDVSLTMDHFIKLTLPLANTANKGEEC